MAKSKTKRSALGKTKTAVAKKKATAKKKTASAKKKKAATKKAAAKKTKATAKKAAKKTKATPKKKAPAKRKSPAAKKTAARKRGTTKTKPNSGGAAARKKLAVRGTKLMHEGHYAKAIKTFEAVLAEDPNHVPAAYGMTYSLGAIADSSEGATRERAIDRTIEMARRLIELTPESDLWPYVEEHRFLRETLRTAYNALAWWGLKRARGESDLLKALADIEHGLGLVSPIDNPEMLGYQDTRVRILLRLGRTDAAYQTVSRNADFSGFEDIISDPAYTAWRRGGGNAAFFESPAGETPHATLVRLQRAISTLGHPTYAALVFSEPIPRDDVAQAEKKLGVRLPTSYVELVTRHGLFKLLWDAPANASDAFALPEFEALEGCRALLSPAEIALETLGARRDFADAGDDETAAMLTECLLFHENYYRDNFFAFRFTDGDADQFEYSVHAFDSDDTFEWQPERIDFARHLRMWVAAVLDDD